MSALINNEKNGNAGQISVSGLLRWLSNMFSSERGDNAKGHISEKNRFGFEGPVIVYQMGKVGSSSVYASLKQMNPEAEIHHVHFMNHLEEIEEHIRKVRLVIDGDLATLRQGKEIRSLIERNPAQIVNLISLVRMPIPRLISSFFQDVEANFPDYKKRMDNNDLTAEELADFFVTSFRDQTPEHWFDAQVKDLFGIDVYSEPFPREKGYHFYQKDNIRLVVIRLEDLSRCATQVFDEFLGISGFRLSNANVASTKDYGSLYKSFKELLKFEAEFIDELNTTKYARHFYSQDELASSVHRF